MSLRKTSALGALRNAITDFPTVCIVRCVARERLQLCRLPRASLCRGCHVLSCCGPAVSRSAHPPNSPHAAPICTRPLCSAAPGHLVPRRPASQRSHGPRRRDEALTAATAATAPPAAARPATTALREPIIKCSSACECPRPGGCERSPRRRSTPTPQRQTGPPTGTRCRQGGGRRLVSPARLGEDSHDRWIGRRRSKAVRERRQTSMPAGRWPTCRRRRSGNASLHRRACGAFGWC